MNTCVTVLAHGHVQVCTHSDLHVSFSGWLLPIIGCVIGVAVVACSWSFQGPSAIRLYIDGLQWLHRPPITDQRSPIAEMNVSTSKGRRAEGHVTASVHTRCDITESGLTPLARLSTPASRLYTCTHNFSNSRNRAKNISSACSPRAGCCTAWISPKLSERSSEPESRACAREDLFAVSSQVGLSACVCEARDGLRRLHASGPSATSADRCASRGGQGRQGC